MNDFAKPLRKLRLQAGCNYARDGKGSHESWFAESVLSCDQRYSPRF